MVTVVATPEPDGPPSRKDDSTTARPAELRRPPMAANEKSMKKRPAPDMLQHGAEDREQNDQAGGHIDGGAEDAFERHVEMRDEVIEGIAAMRPGRRQVLAVDGVEQESDGHARHDPAGGAARAFEQQHDEDDADVVVGGGRHGRAVAEVGALREHVADGAGAGRGEQVVPPADAVAEPARHRKQQEAEHQHHADVGRAQHVRGHDVVGRVQVEQRDEHGSSRDGDTDPAAQPVERAFLFLDVLLELLARVLGQVASGGTTVLSVAFMGLVSTRTPSPWPGGLIWLVGRIVHEAAAAG